VVSSGPLPEANVNEIQFTILFEELIENAIRYRDDAPPRIDILSEEAEDGHVISIRDNGMGIKPEYHRTVFQPFKRLHGKEISGIGLGLAICSKIASAHQGRIWVESEGANGSVFKITLPF
jgi:light-regulated signal transduction histidine kinase (bacteriophytochrome)